MDKLFEIYRRPIQEKKAPPCLVWAKVHHHDRGTTDTTLIQVNNDSHPPLLESDDISAYVVVRAKNFDSGHPAPPRQEDGKQSYFSSKGRRLFSLQIQFRLKKDWNGDDLHLGTHLNGPFRKLPRSAQVATRIALLIDPDLTIQLHDNPPWASSPLLSAVNVLHVRNAAEEESFIPIQKAPPWQFISKQMLRWTMRGPDSLHYSQSSPSLPSTSSSSSQPTTSTESTTTGVHRWPWRPGQRIHESTELLLGRCSVPASKRKRLFHSAEHRQSCSFSKDHIYCFDLYTSHLDLTAKQVHLGWTYDASKYLGQQPVTYTLWSKDHAVTLLSVVFEQL